MVGQWFGRAKLRCNYVRRERSQVWMMCLYKCKTKRGWVGAHVHIHFFFCGCALVIVIKWYWKLSGGKQGKLLRVEFQKACVLCLRTSAYYRNTLNKHAVWGTNVRDAKMGVMWVARSAEQYRDKGRNWWTPPERRLSSHGWNKSPTREHQHQ